LVDGGPAERGAVEEIEVVWPSGVGKRRDKTGLEKEMRTLYVEGLANHDGPEPWSAGINRHRGGNERVLR